MKLLLLISLFILSSSLSAQEFNNATLGFAAGFRQDFDDINDYSLTADSNHLVVEPTKRYGFVLSTILTIKFTKIQRETSGAKRLVNSQGTTLTPLERLVMTVGLNVLQASKEVKFNTRADGGLGIGYLFNETTTVSLMFEATSVRQMRDYIVDKYQGKGIPNGTDFYNALDVNDDRLFRNKLITGISLKAVVTL